MKQKTPRPFPPAPRTGLLGGTFNPVHLAHLRLAASAAEALRLDRVELVPGSVPPHKPAAGLLPFALRCALLEAAVRDYPKLEVSRLEAELSPPSYTWNLIAAWKERHGGEAPLFILGAEDFAQLENWHRGRELPGETSFLVVPRGRADEAAFRDTVDRLRPGAKVESLLLSNGTFVPAPVLLPDPKSGEEAAGKEPRLLGAPLSDRTACLYLPLPLLDISASQVRIKWLRGESVRFLVPDPVIAVLDARAGRVRKDWSVFLRTAMPSTLPTRTIRP